MENLDDRGILAAPRRKGFTGCSTRPPTRNWLRLRSIPFHSTSRCGGSKEKFSFSTVRAETGSGEGHSRAERLRARRFRPQRSLQESPASNSSSLVFQANHGWSSLPSLDILISPDSTGGHDRAHPSRDEGLGKETSQGVKRVSTGMRVENVILDDAGLHGVSFGRIPFDADREPVLGGDEDMIPLGRFSLHIIPSPE